MKKIFLCVCLLFSLVSGKVVGGREGENPWQINVFRPIRDLKLTIKDQEIQRLLTDLDSYISVWHVRVAAFEEGREKSLELLQAAFYKVGAIVAEICEKITGETKAGFEKILANIETLAQQLDIDTKK